MGLVLGHTVSYWRARVRFQTPYAVHFLLYKEQIGTACLKCAEVSHPGPPPASGAVGVPSEHIWIPSLKGYIQKEPPEGTVVDNQEGAHHPRATKSESGVGRRLDAFTAS